RRRPTSVLSPQSPVLNPCSDIRALSQRVPAPTSSSRLETHIFFVSAYSRPSWLRGSVASWLPPTIDTSPEYREHRRARLPLPRDWLPGYELLDEIHRGGRGVFYRAIQKPARRTVAIKVMREGPFAGANDQARFEREVQILGQLRHPNIVAVHDGGMAAGH